NNMKREATIFEMVAKGRQHGLVHLTTELEAYNGREIQFDGRKVINFSSCSYLGLSLDRRLTDGAIAAMNQFGHSFPTSRSYISMGMLEHLEQQLEKVFGYPTLLCTTTSLGHFAYLPSIVGPADAVILDHQVHHSVSTAAQVLKAQGCHMEVIRHNHMEKLEARIEVLKQSHPKVWYLGDGIYSMYGDMAPIKALHVLLDRHPQFNVYLDDAHGMSWMGDNGAGYVLSQGPLHPRMALITSLGKAFGSLGGAMVFPNADLKAKVKQTGGPMIFSSPMTPGNIGAALAATEIHLSPEITSHQKALHTRIDHFRNRALDLGIPLIGRANTPIFFIPVGSPDAAFEIGRQMLEAGFYQSFSVFPSVPLNNAGLRYTLTNWLELEDIDNMLVQLSQLRTAVLRKMGITTPFLKRSFKGVAWLDKSPVSV
ncbi:MAG: aminotransferase class I/II-fold pyridoxal phosphate-dependent enzyme, partial [Bacteroidota bacterium]